MKFTLLGTVAAVGLFALPTAAFASPPDVGMVELHLGFGSTDDDWTGRGNSFFDDPIAYGGRTQWLFPLTKPIHLQADLFAEQIVDVLHGGEGGWPSTDSSLFGATAHILHPMENTRLGIAGSLFNMDAFQPFTNNSWRTSVDYGLVQAEAQYFTERWTLFLNGGWFGDISGCDGAEGCVHDGVFIGGSATHFFTRNAMVQLGGTVFWGDDNRRGTVSGGIARLEGEYKFADSCFSGFAGLEYETEEVKTLFGQADQQTIMFNIGLRMYIDNGTLFSFSQDGPSMRTPTFHHALAAEGPLQFNAVTGGP